MSGLEITLLVLGLAAIGGIVATVQILVEQKQRKLQFLNDERFWDLLDEFDENYLPTIPEDETDDSVLEAFATRVAAAQFFKEQLIKTFYRKK